MRTRAVLGSIFASAAVLIVGWQAGSTALANSASSSTTSAGTTGDSTAGASGSTSGASGSTAAGSSDGSTSSATETSSGAADGTYAGTSVSTRFGSVQVSVTIAGGTITDVTALHLTDADGRSRQISNRAAPILRDEVIASQSADVANVSGATYTTDGYLSSLQSALDQAGL